MSDSLTHASSREDSGIPNPGRHTSKSIQRTVRLRRWYHIQATAVETLAARLLCLGLQCATIRCHCFVRRAGRPLGRHGTSSHQQYDPATLEIISSGCHHSNFAATMVGRNVVHQHNIQFSCAGKETNHAAENHGLLTVSARSLVN